MIGPQNNVYNPFFPQVILLLCICKMSLASVQQHHWLDVFPGRRLQGRRLAFGGKGRDVCLKTANFGVTDCSIQNARGGLNPLITCHSKLWIIRNPQTCCILYYKNIHSLKYIKHVFHLNFKGLFTQMPNVFFLTHGCEFNDTCSSEKNYWQYIKVVHEKLIS